MKNKLLEELRSKVKSMGKSVVEVGWTVDGKLVIEAPLRCREYVRFITTIENNKIHVVILDVLKGRRYSKNPDLVSYILRNMSKQSDYFEVKMERAEIIIYGIYDSSGVTGDDLFNLFRTGMRFADEVFCELEGMLLGPWEI